MITNPDSEGGISRPLVIHSDNPPSSPPRIGAYDVRTGLLLPPTILRPLGGRLPKPRRNGARALRRAFERQRRREEGW
jgi:hypothetical protein